MPRTLPLAAALPLCALLAAPAAAASYFEFEIRGTFADAVIDGTPIDQEFVITGRTTTGLTGAPWADNPVIAPVDISSLSVTYGGSPLAATYDAGPFTYGLLGTDAVPNDPSLFEFRRDPDTGAIDVRAQTPFDSISFQTLLGGRDAWFGFGGEGGQRMGLTIEKVDGVVQYGEDLILGRLRPGQTTRSAILIDHGPTPIPLPAAGWLLVSAVAGLAAAGARRRG